MRASSARALPESEPVQVLAHLPAPRFADRTPTKVFAALPDEGTCPCGVRTMYRILAAGGRLPNADAAIRFIVPRRQGEAPNKARSWDIIRLTGLAKGSFCCIQVIPGIGCRRFVELGGVGWRTGTAKSAGRLEALFIGCGGRTCRAA